MAEALNETGTLHRVLGDLSQARDCHQQALRLARQVNSVWDEAYARAGLGRCALLDGRAPVVPPKLPRICGKHGKSSSGSAQPRPASFPANWLPSHGTIQTC